MGNKSEGVERASNLFENGHNCAQSVLMAFCERYGLDGQMARKLSSGLGGGVGRKGDICGAANGACMVLGLHVCSTPGASEKDIYQAVIADVQKFLDTFRERCGALDCRDLIGFDISTEQGRAEARSQDVFKQRCPGFVRAAAEILEEMIAGSAADNSK